MTITVTIPTVLRNECGGTTQLVLPGGTVRAVLDQLQRDYPGLYRSVCDETGAVRRHINLFVNDALLRAGERLDTPLASGDVLTIMTAVSGG